MPTLPIDAQLEGELAQGLRPSEVGIQAATQAGYHAQREFGVLGKAVNDVSDTIENHETLKSNIAAADQSTAIQIKARQGWRAALAADPNVDPNDWVRDNVRPDIDKMGDLANTPASKAHVAQLQHELLGSLSVEFNADRNKVDTDSAEASVDDVWRQAGKDAHDNPANVTGILQLARTQSAGILQAGGVPAALQDKHINARAQEAGDSALLGIAGRAEASQMTGAQIDAQIAALKDPKNPIRIAASQAGYDAAMERLEKAKATQGNIAAAVQDVQRPLLLDAVRNGDPKAYDTLTAMSQNPKGDTPKERAVYTAEIIRDRDEAKGFAQGAQTISNMSEQDARHMVESMPLEGARTEAQKGVVAAYKDRVEGLNKDPMGWIASHNQTAANAYAAWQNNPSPQTWASFAITQTAIQKRLRPDQPVHLLTPETKAQAQDIVRSITQTPEGAAGASKSLYVMAQTFGDSWHSIAHDLMDEHILSREQYAAARLYGDPAKQGEGERILTASAMKAGDRFDMKGIPEAKARKEAQTALQPFSDSLGNVNDSADVIAGFTDALTHVLQVNGDPNNLTTLAASEAQKMLLSEYSFAGATHTIRVPSGVDADTVTNASEYELGRIDKRDLVIPLNRSGTLNPENQAENYKRTIQLTARWYTNEDGSGIKLYDQDRHNVMERKGGKAVPVSLSWADLTRGEAARNETRGRTGEENISTYQGR